MATNRLNKIKITLDQNGESGYSTRLRARGAGMAAAREAICASGGCTATCPQEGGKIFSPTRVAADDDIVDAVKIYRYQDADRDHSFGWYLDGDVNTCCQCVENTK